MLSQTFYHVRTPYPMYYLYFFLHFPNLLEVVQRARPSYNPRGTCPRWAERPAAPSGTNLLTQQFLSTWYGGTKCSYALTLTLCSHLNANANCESKLQRCDNNVQQGNLEPNELSITYFNCDNSPPTWHASIRGTSVLKLCHMNFKNNNFIHHCSHGVPYLKKYVKKSRKKYNKPQNSPKKSTTHKVGTLKSADFNWYRSGSKTKRQFFIIFVFPTNFFLLLRLYKNIFD
jgi:hypothetical protein